MVNKRKKFDTTKELTDGRVREAAPSINNVSGVIDIDYFIDRHYADLFNITFRATLISNHS